MEGGCTNYEYLSLTKYPSSELSTSKHSTGTLKSSPEDTTWSMVASPLSSPEISTNSSPSTKKMRCCTPTPTLPLQQFGKTINCAIFLDNSHRFKDDPVYGLILARMRMGEDTVDDRREINKRVIGTHSVTLPENAPDVCYACPTNQERNGVTAATFKRHIKDTHPDIDDHINPPDHTLMIEASVATSGAFGQKKNNKKRKRGQRKRVATAVHDAIISQLGDDDIKATDWFCQGAKIEPALRVYPGSHHMCITNENLDQGRGNGTLCKCLRVKLKQNGQERKWKNWDGKKVWTVSIDSVEWIEFEHYHTIQHHQARKQERSSSLPKNSLPQSISHYTQTYHPLKWGMPQSRKYQSIPT